MKEGYTHINFLLDQSPSMSTIREETIQGFNLFLKGQQETAQPEDTFTLSVFSRDHAYRYKMARISDVQPLSDKTYNPGGGGTALLDSAAESIRDLGKHLSSLKEEDRPSKVIFVILTDGEENCSRSTTKIQLNQLITDHTNTWKWEFVFLGANQDAIKEAAQYGIGLHSAMTFAATREGITAGYESINRSLNTYKVAPVGVNFVTSGAAFTDAERTSSMGGTPPSANVSVDVTVKTGTV